MKARITIICILIAVLFAASTVLAACNNKPSPITSDSSIESSASGGGSDESDSSVGNGGDSSTESEVVDPDKTVSKIEVEKEPDKTYYEVGDEFTVEGGVIKVTYTDGSTQLLPMSSPSFTVATPSMSAVGTKNINVRCGTKKCTFTVRVASKSYAITYNLNYVGAPAPEVVSVVKGQTADDRRPVREGYTFVAWYANEDFVYQYDFTKGVDGDAELFAFWKRNGAEFVDVTFDRGYYGDLYETYGYPVEVNTAVRRPADPVRAGYRFDKWTVSGFEYDFSMPVTDDMTIRANWIKTTSGRNVYVFEAEDTSLKGKVGPAFSGTCSEEAMIVIAPENRGCSNGRFVSYLYRYENSLEFYIACDENVSDATIYARLSAELRDFTYDPTNFAIELNDVPLSYNAIAFVGVPKSEDEASFLDCLPFEDYTIAVNATLKKGANVIRLITRNNVAMEGTTLEAAAPIVDCIKIETTGVVIWDANRGLPASNY